jgi:hypothetical protein
MWKNKRILPSAFVIAMLAFPWPIPEVVVAQGKASVPRPQDTLALGENAARDLLLLIEPVSPGSKLWFSDGKVTDTIEQGNRVALFGSFTYKSNVTGKEITSPFGLLARFEGEKVAYVQFLEDSYGTAGSFKTGGKTRFHSDPSGKEVEV